MVTEAPVWEEIGSDVFENLCGKIRLRELPEYEDCEGCLLFVWVDEYSKAVLKVVDVNDRMQYYRRV